MLGAASRENKMNNNSIMEQRIKGIKTMANQAEVRNDVLNEQDPNQYYRIVNKKKYIECLTNQVKTGRATGNCLRENMAVFALTLQRILKGTELATEAKYFHYQYGDERRGKEYTGNHMAVMVKINNVWYVRCHSNNVEQQRELNGWFEDRCNFKIKGNASYLPITKKGNEINIQFDGIEKLIPFKLNHYLNHNKFILTLRNEW